MAPKNRYVPRTPIKMEQPQTEEAVSEVKVEKPIVEEEPAPVEEKIVEVEAVVDGVNSCLNIRREPEVKPNNQIAILGKGTKIVVIDPEKPVKNKDTEWFKVKIKNDNKGEERGYAMKKYIKII